MNCVCVCVKKNFNDIFSSEFTLTNVYIEDIHVIILYSLQKQPCAEGTQVSAFIYMKNKKEIIEMLKVYH